MLYFNIAKMPVHDIDLSQADRKFHIKKGRVNSDLPFLKTKELIIFEVAHRLTKITSLIAVAALCLLPRDVANVDQGADQ